MYPKDDSYVLLSLVTEKEYQINLKYGVIFLIIVSLINMKGGVAKTTMAINLADCLATRHDKKVLLVDVDPQFNATQCLMSPSTYMEHSKKNEDTVLNIFDRTTRILPSAVANAEPTAPKKLQDIQTISIKDNFDLLPGNLELYRFEMAPGDGRENRLRNYLDTIDNEYDYVVIDTPPTPSVWMTSALIASDYYLITVKADPISLTGIDLLKSIIEEKKENFRLSIKCAGLILTIAERNTNVYTSARNNLESDAYWKKHLYPVSLPKRVGIAQMQLEQTHILDSNNDEAKIAIARIATEFRKRVKDDD